MSDHDDDFMCEDEEDYGLENSEDSNSEPDVDPENQYYNSKALREDVSHDALKSFQKVLDLENKIKIKINFKLAAKLPGNDEPVHAIDDLHQKCWINSIRDYISTSKNKELLQNFYETTLQALKDAKNDRLSFSTNAKLGKLYFDRNNLGKLQKILKQLHLSCQAADGENNLKKGTLLLDPGGQQYFLLADSSAAYGLTEMVVNQVPRMGTAVDTDY